MFSAARRRRLVLNNLRTKMAPAIAGASLQSGAMGFGSLSALRVKARAGMGGRTNWVKLQCSQRCLCGSPLVI